MFPIHIAPTPDPVTRRKSGTCAVFSDSYLSATAAIDTELIRGCVRLLRLGRVDTGEGKRRFGGATPEIPKARTGPSSWSQSRAPTSPIWRLGEQRRRSVRDPIGTAALARTNQVGVIIRPGNRHRGLESPYRVVKSHGGDREKNGSLGAPTPVSPCAGRPCQPWAATAVLFLCRSLRAPPPVCGRPSSNVTLTYWCLRRGWS